MTYETGALPPSTDTREGKNIAMENETAFRAWYRRRRFQVGGALTILAATGAVVVALGMGGDEKQPAQQAPSVALEAQYAPPAAEPAEIDSCEGSLCALGYRDEGPFVESVWRELTELKLGIDFDAIPGLADNGPMTVYSHDSAVDGNGMVREGAIPPDSLFVVLEDDSLKPVLAYMMDDNGESWLFGVGEIPSAQAVPWFIPQVMEVGREARWGAAPIPTPPHLGGGDPSWIMFWRGKLAV